MDDQERLAREMKEFEELIKFVGEIFRSGPPRIKKVYILEFQDGTIKIGVSKNPKVRSKIIAKQSGRKLDISFATKEFPANIAIKIETIMKQELKEYRLDGEFYEASLMEAYDVFEYAIDALAKRGITPASDRNDE